MRSMLAVLLLILSVPVFATEYGEQVNITSIRPYSEVSQIPGLNKIIRVYFENISWGSNVSCRGTAADLSKDDTHVLSVLLTGWVASKQVFIYIDDSVPKLQSDVCRIVNVDIK